MSDAWPDWLSEVRASLRTVLSSRVVTGRCSVCRRRKRCRYAITTDTLFCSEACWDDRQKQIAEDKSFNMTAGR